MNIPFIAINTAIVATMTTIIVFYLLFYKPLKDRATTLEISKKNYLRKQGGTTYGRIRINKEYEVDRTLGKDFINYDLRSFDGGKNWYAVDYNFETKEVKIIGEAEKVYPGLLNHLESWDRLINYVKDNGPINPSDEKGVSIFEKAGFSFHQKN